MLTKNSKIFIAGHNGLVGNAVFRLLKSKNYKRLIFADKSKLNLLDLKKVDNFFKRLKPDFLIICAARVGGILENKNYQLDFLLDNINIQNNLLICSNKYLSLIHISEPTRRTPISYAVFCLKKSPQIKGLSVRD